jgi:hypothetical protein
VHPTLFVRYGSPERRSYGILVICHFFEGGPTKPERGTPDASLS